MGGCTSWSPTRRMSPVKCMWSAVAVATLVVILLVMNLAALSGSSPLTRSISNRFEALPNPRLILREFPSTLSSRVRHLDEDLGFNHNVGFTDAQFMETIEQQYEKLISSQVWLRKRVAWEEHDLQKAPEIKFDTGPHELTVTLFSAPPAFSGSESDLNRQALLSWLHLSPRPHVVLLGNHSSLHTVAAEFPDLVTVEPNIDYSCTGVPLFHSMVARANAAVTNVTVLVHPTAVLLQDFMPGLRKLAGTFPDWALVSQRLEISELPFRFAHKGGGIVFLEHSVTGDSMIDRELASFVRSSGKLELREGVNVWAWTVSDTEDALFAPPMPPFTYDAGYHDQWMARGFAKGARIVVDVTDALVGFHIREPLRVVDGSGDDDMATPTWSPVDKNWQSVANLYLYRRHRNIAAEEKDLLSGGWKLIGCPEPFMIKLCISESHSAANPCHCENIFSRPVSGTWYAETVLEKEARLRLEVIQVPALWTELLPLHSLDQLLPKVADAQKNVVVVGITCGAYLDMLWSFMCRARALDVTNVLVAAGDKSVYEAALTRSLPVFYAGQLQTEEAEDAATDTSCTQRGELWTKWKVQVILQVLRKGFHVVWSDPDVVWFRNPLPFLTSTFKAGALVVASDEPDPNRPANNRVNPGFLYARAEKATIKTFKELERNARSSAADQLLFRQALCGRRAQGRVGAAECTSPTTSLRTFFLDRRVFANSKANGYWSHQNVTQVAASNGVYVLHNSGLPGAENKVRRQKAKLIWFYNVAARMCVQPWQRPRNGSSIAGDGDGDGDASIAGTGSV